MDIVLKFRPKEKDPQKSYNAILSFTSRGKSLLKDLQEIGEASLNH